VCVLVPCLYLGLSGNYLDHQANVITSKIPRRINKALQAGRNVALIKPQKFSTIRRTESGES